MWSFRALRHKRAQYLGGLSSNDQDCGVGAPLPEGGFIASGGSPQTCERFVVASRVLASGPWLTCDGCLETGPDAGPQAASSGLPTSDTQANTKMSWKSGAVAAE